MSQRTHLSQNRAYVGHLHLPGYVWYRNPRRNACTVFVVSTLKLPAKSSPEGLLLPGEGRSLLKKKSFSFTFGCWALPRIKYEFQPLVYGGRQLYFDCHKTKQISFAPFPIYNFLEIRKTSLQNSVVSAMLVLKLWPSCRFKLTKIKYIHMYVCIWPVLPLRPFSG